MSRFPTSDEADDGDVLQHLRWRLDERREVFGCTTTFDPDLHLVVDGVPVLADRVDDTVHVFRLQSPAREVRIVSRSSVPAELDVAFADIRRLGVNVSRVVLSSDDVNIVVGCRDTSLVDGFHASEDSHRWTDGDARIPAKFVACFGKDVTIEVHVAGLRAVLPRRTVGSRAVCGQCRRRACRGDRTAERCRLNACWVQRRAGRGARSAR